MSFLLHFYSWCAYDLRLSYQQFKRSEFVMAMTLLNSLVDLSSIENCVKDNYTPKFAQFRLGECRSARFICIPKMSTDTTYARHYDQEKNCYISYEKCVIDQEYTYLQIQMG